MSVAGPHPHPALHTPDRALRYGEVKEGCRVSRSGAEQNTAAPLLSVQVIKLSNFKMLPRVTTSSLMELSL